MTGVDRYSLVGDWGYSWRWYGVNPLLQKFDTEMKVYKAGENKAMPNPFEDIRQKDLEQ